MKPRYISAEERAAIAARYGIAPHLVPNAAKVGDDAHGSAGTTPPQTPRQTLNIWYRNEERAKKFRKAREMPPPPAPEPLPAPVMATWGDD